MKLPQNGGCQCGALRYEVTQAPSMVYACHCMDCQRMTSSAFSMGIVLPADAFRLVAGEPRVMKRTTDSGRVSTRWVCRNVGRGSPTAQGRAFGMCEPAPWTTPRGCVRLRTSGPVASNRGWRPEGAQSFETQPADMQGFLYSSAETR